MSDYDFKIGSVRIWKDGRHYTIMLPTKNRYSVRYLDVHHSQVTNLRRALDKLDEDMIKGEA